MNHWVFLYMGISLVLTILLEAIFAVAVGIRNKRDFILICLVNILTNPAASFTYYLLVYYTACNSTLILLGLETLAILVEFYYFKCYGKSIKHPLLFAVCINTFSFGIGKIVNLIFY